MAAPVGETIAIPITNEQLKNDAGIISSALAVEPTAAPTTPSAETVEHVSETVEAPVKENGIIPADDKENGTQLQNGTASLVEKEATSAEDHVVEEKPEPIPEPSAMLDDKPAELPEDVTVCNAPESNGIATVEQAAVTETQEASKEEQNFLSEPKPEVTVEPAEKVGPEEPREEPEAPKEQVSPSENNGTELEPEPEKVSIISASKPDEASTNDLEAPTTEPVLSDAAEIHAVKPSTAEGTASEPIKEAFEASRPSEGNVATETVAEEPFAAAAVVEHTAEQNPEDSAVEKQTENTAGEGSSKSPAAQELTTEVAAVEALAEEAAEQTIPETKVEVSEKTAKETTTEVEPVSDATKNAVEDKLELGEVKEPTVDDSKPESAPAVIESTAETAEWEAPEVSAVENKSVPVSAAGEPEGESLAAEESTPHSTVPTNGQGLELEEKGEKLSTENVASEESVKEGFESVAVPAAPAETTEPTADTKPIEIPIEQRPSELASEAPTQQAESAEETAEVPEDKGAALKTAPLAEVPQDAATEKSVDEPQTEQAVTEGTGEAGVELEKKDIAVSSGPELASAPAYPSAAEKQSELEPPVAEEASVVSPSLEEAAEGSETEPPQAKEGAVIEITSHGQSVEIPEEPGKEAATQPNSEETTVTTEAVEPVKESTEEPIEEGTQECKAEETVTATEAAEPPEESITEQLDTQALATAEKEAADDERKSEQISAILEPIEPIAEAAQGSKAEETTAVPATAELEKEATEVSPEKDTTEQPKEKETTGAMGIIESEKGAVISESSVEGTAENEAVEGSKVEETAVAAEPDEAAKQDTTAEASIEVPAEQEIADEQPKTEALAAVTESVEPVRETAAEEPAEEVNASETAASTEELVREAAPEEPKVEQSTVTVESAELVGAPIEDAKAEEPPVSSKAAEEPVTETRTEGLVAEEPSGDKTPSPAEPEKQTAAETTEEEVVAVTESEGESVKRLATAEAPTAHPEPEEEAATEIPEGEGTAVRTTLPEDPVQETLTPETTKETPSKREDAAATTSPVGGQDQEPATKDLPLEVPTNTAQNELTSEEPAGKAPTGEHFKIEESKTEEHKLEETATSTATVEAPTEAPNPENGPTTDEPKVEQTLAVAADIVEEPTKEDATAPAAAEPEPQKLAVAENTEGETPAMVTEATEVPATGSGIDETVAEEQSASQHLPSVVAESSSLASPSEEGPVKAESANDPEGEAPVETPDAAKPTAGPETQEAPKILVDETSAIETRASESVEELAEGEVTVTETSVPETLPETSAAEDLAEDLAEDHAVTDADTSEKPLDTETPTEQLSQPITAEEQVVPAPTAAEEQAIEEAAPETPMQEVSASALESESEKSETENPAEAVVEGETAGVLAGGPSGAVVDNEATETDAVEGSLTETPDAPVEVSQGQIVPEQASTDELQTEKQQSDDPTIPAVGEVQALEESPSKGMEQPIEEQSAEEPVPKELPSEGETNKDTTAVQTTADESKPAVREPAVTETAVENPTSAKVEPEETQPSTAAEEPASKKAFINAPAKDEPTPTEPLAEGIIQEAPSPKEATPGETISETPITESPLAAEVKAAEERPVEANLEAAEEQVEELAPVQKDSPEQVADPAQQEFIAKPAVTETFAKEEPPVTTEPPNPPIPDTPSEPTEEEVQVVAVEEPSINKPTTEAAPAEPAQPSHAQKTTEEALAAQEPTPNFLPLNEAPAAKLAVVQAEERLNEALSAPDSQAESSKNTFLEDQAPVQQEQPIASKPAATEESIAPVDAAAHSVEEGDIKAQASESAAGGNKSTADEEEALPIAEQPTQKAVPEAMEEGEGSSPIDSVLSHGATASGAAVVAVGAVATGAAAITSRKEEPAPVKEIEVPASQSETDKNTLAVPSERQLSRNDGTGSTLKEPPTPEPEADPALAALAGDGEALLRKLQLPSTDQLLASAESAPQDAKDANQENETPTIVKSGPSTTTQPAPTTGGAANEATASNGDENPRSPSQNRSVTAVSLNHKNDSWLRNILRAVFVNFFGSIFAPFRRRGRRDH
ncbi:PT repeat family protein [Aspergillus lucknowensis]|uniref:Uncharacterized protein n=1 Tax=Aspergillus lucknowensis TaxID=176173 RepID=A0ABR4LJZ9_9EURO